MPDEEMLQIDRVHEVEDQDPVVVATVPRRRAPLALDQIQVGTILEDSNGFQIHVVQVDRSVGTFLTEDAKVELPCLSVQRLFMLEASILTFFNVIRSEVVGTSKETEPSPPNDDSACEK